MDLASSMSGCGAAAQDGICEHQVGVAGLEHFAFRGAQSPASRSLIAQRTTRSAFFGEKRALLGRVGRVGCPLPACAQCVVRRLTAALPIPSRCTGLQRHHHRGASRCLGNARA
eukprot:359821-Chlamydomonas_euryale.AAC.12